MLRELGRHRPGETVPVVVVRKGTAYKADPVSYTHLFSERFPRKPEPDSLLSIVRSWGMEPEQVCMVGDSAHDLSLIHI